MKAVRKPIPVEVVQVGSVEAVAAQYPFIIFSGFRVYNELHDSFVGFKLGDYLCVEDPHDVYPIDRALFERSYTVVNG